MAKESIKQLAKAWQAMMDLRGPFVPFSELSEALESAPPEIHEEPGYLYYEGLAHGRMIHEKLGGLQ